MTPAMYQFQTYADFLRRVSRGTSFVLLIKHHEDQDISCILDIPSLQQDLHYLNAQDLPALVLLLETFCLPEVLAFDQHGQVVTRAHLDMHRFAAQHLNAELVNKAFRCCAK